MCVRGTQAETERRAHETVRAEKDREEKIKIFSAKQEKYRVIVDAKSIALRAGQAKMVPSLPF